MKNLKRLLILVGILFLQAIPTLVAAQTVINGVVLDETGKPLPSAVIKLKGGNKSSVTNENGEFRIPVPQNIKTITVTFLGYHDQDVSVNGTKNLTVKMLPNLRKLDEVVVIGYGTQKKSDVTGAIGSVDQETIAKSGVTSIEQVLQGRIAGVQMTTNSGMPGGGTSIQIRGLNSINSTNEPIYVIDGVIIASGTGQYTTNAFAFINPADIESIEVLKDASATAIYGSQGANGVILITTKKGNSGMPRITIDAKYGVQSLQKYLDMTNLREYAQHANDRAIFLGQAINPNFSNPSLLGTGTDWQREIFRPAAMSNFNFSASGGTDVTTYVISGSYLNQEGASAGSGFNRFTFSTGIDSKIKPWAKLAGKLTLSRTDQLASIAEWNIINSAVRQSPSVPVRNLDGTYGGPEDLNDQLSNPLAIAELLDRGNKKLNVLGNVSLDVTPYKWLSLKTEFATNLDNDQGRRFIPTYTLGARVNSLIENQQTQRYSSNWSWRNLATFKYTFNKKHNINAVLGHEMTERYSNSLSGLRYGGSNDLRDLDAGDIINSLPTGSTNYTKFNSVFGRLNYTLNNRYILTSTLRYDGSSNFAEGKRWGLFPSAAFAWRVSQESFMKNITEISNLKLRFGYGKVGNSNIRQFAYAAMLANVPTIWGTGQVVANVPNADVTWESTSSFNLGLDLGLFKNKIDLVVDLYTKRTDDLLLSLNLPAITGTAGVGSASSPWGNVGSMENRGVEVALKTQNLTRKNFSWSSNIVFTANRNRVLQLNAESAIINKTYQLSGSDIIVTRTQPGRSIGEFYAYKTIGRINSAADIYDADGKVKIAIPEGQIIDQTNGIGVGDLIWDDFNQDGVINEKDRQFVGSPLPKFTLGLGNNFTYKNFDFSIFFQGSYGNKVMNFLNLNIDDPNLNFGNLTRRAGVDYARVSLINPSGSATDINNLIVTGGDDSMPRLSRNNINSNNRLSSRFVEDGSYIRLQTLNLGYTLPAKYSSKIGLSSVRVNVNVQNLFTITGYSGYDPEIGMVRDQYSNSGQNALLNGIDVGRYPSPRNVIFGLTVGL
ncbi:TonB-dependent receptor [Pedobacter sp. MC2016-14]|uniref:SusC/RagA family TonB-linked outer membrane protein n=1 Tax=Pedobacter sp. MC2016-14 TaxID=2897327 RepID=UPI001E309D3E|nr:TonB-dependent receptor [Pedobacter sp. MC2016-14]MCD0489166.1 TonB-dependent receptor [Pedobacter sp. MC2016-14]